MRLTSNQVQSIQHVAQRVLGANVRVRVFGSMALDQRKGGDIDLFFETGYPFSSTSGKIAKWTRQ